MRVKSGSITSLLHHLIAEANNDPEFTLTFAVCGHLFVAVEKIFAFFRRAHGKIVAGTNASLNRRLMNRLLDVLTTCLPHYWEQLQKDDIDSVYEMMATGIRMGLCAPVHRLRVQLFQLRPFAPLPSLKADLRVCSSRLLMDFGAQELAQQLTLLQYKTLKGVKLKEMLIWRCKQDKVACPSLVTAIDLFNSMSAWCSTLIITPQTRGERAKVFTRMVEVMESLRRHNDFASLFALIAGAQTSSVARMTHTMDLVRGSTHEQLQRLARLLNNDSSFKKYREALSQARPPCVPYLGLHLTDLTFTEGVLKNTVPCSDGCDNDLINFRKV